MICVLVPQDAFFLQGEPIGGEEICPRDGRRGCAMVDVLRREHRRQCTHFLSWAWCPSAMSSLLILDYNLYRIDS